MCRNKKKTVVFLVVVFLSIGLLCLMLRTQYVVPILMYHSVGPFSAKWERLTVLPSTFERQMRFLRSHHYSIITVEELAELLKEKKKIPHNTVVITFDDGMLNNYEYAFPVLKKYRIPATIFVIANEVARPQGYRLNWEQIQEMQNSGLVVIGSHALDSVPLTNISQEDEIKKQIIDSKKILEEKLKRKVNTFSYPEGRFTEQIRRFVIDAGYTAAVATNPGKKFSNKDIFALKRLRISSNAHNLFVFWVQASGYYNFIREHRHK